MTSTRFNVSVTGMISSMLLNLLLFWLVGAKLNKLWIPQHRWAQILPSIILFAFGYLLLTSFGYLLTPLFFDHGESTLASVAANWGLGGEMYTRFDSADQYTHLYGPWPYIIVAGFLNLGSATLVFAKLPGVLNLWAALGIFYFLTRQLRLTRFERVLMTGGLAMMMVGYYQSSYFIRPDSFLLINIVLTILVIEKIRNRFLVYTLVGLLGAISFNCKINAPAYFLPLAAYYLEKDKRNWSPLGLLLSLFVFFVGAAAPFWLPRISGIQFYNWINLPWVASGQKYPIMDGIKGITYGAAFLLVLWFYGVAKNYRATFIVFTIVTIITGLIAGTPGSGVWMFLPMMPFYLWLFAKAYADATPEQRRANVLIVAAMILTLGLNDINRQKRVIELFRQTPQRWAEFNDMKALAATVDGPLELGYGSPKEYELSFYKPWLVHHGRGLFMDACALMKITYSGVPIPQATYDKIAACEVPHFIVPKTDAPFTVENFYTWKPLFPKELRESILAHYKVKSQSQFYELWECTPKQ